MVPPFQGLGGSWTSNPGRCPGLSQFAPLGLRMSFPLVRHSRAGGNPALLQAMRASFDRHSRAGGNPVITRTPLDSRLRGNDWCTGFPPARERLVWGLRGVGGLPWRHPSMLLDQFDMLVDQFEGGPVRC